jgi:phosphoglucomutase
MQNNLSEEAQKNVDTWLTEPRYSEYKDELETLLAKQDWKKLEDSFYTVIPFGTGGRRGTVGIGSNRINKVTIGESAQGFADYLVSELGNDAKKQGIVIAHDTRTTSREFAEYTAGIFAANGFTTYLFDSFRATPELSFAVRHLQTVGGIVISASHNPPADNGFKAYWSDGGQIVPPHDKGIIDAVMNVTNLPEITGLTGVTIINKEVDDAYISAIAKESLSQSRSAKIVYSPLHGTGSTSAQKILEHVGFTDLTIVAEQATPDGTFPNLPNNIPNPEVPSASEMLTEYATRLRADIAISTDPDADRLGVVCADANGSYKLLTGNQIAALAAYYVAQKGAKGFMVRTIVTTDLLDAIAQDFGLKIYNNILVGFKYVAQLIREHQDNGDETFLIGGEESYGLLKGSYCRDKDAAVAALLLCELASELKDQGKTLMWQLDELYKKYGVFTETLTNISYPGAEGFANMQRIMKELRINPPKEITGTPIVNVIDRLDPKNGEIGNVLVFVLSEDGHNRITIRPSGTEPKIKIYTQLHAEVDADLEQIKKSESARANALAEALQKLAQ